MLTINDMIRRAALKRKYAMMNLRIKGWSDQRIADHYSISRQRVHVILGPRRADKAGK